MVIDETMVLSAGRWRNWTRGRRGPRGRRQRRIRHSTASLEVLVAAAF
jgi:hypothetical protein